MSEPTILRVFRFRPCRPHPDVALRDSLIPDLLRLDGLVDARFGRQGPDEAGHRIEVSLWSSRAAMAEGLGASVGDLRFHQERLGDITDPMLEVLPLEFSVVGRDDVAPGILRHVHGSVRAGELDAYVAEAHAGTLDDARSGRGPVALHLARHGTDSFVTVSAWATWSDLEAATGGTIARPIATRHAERLVAWDVGHYEVIEVDRPEPGALG